jgi:UPF0042 nucleotide-binding protein
MRQLVVVTGLSGSGKSLAARCFEDLGYFCVDNLPVALIPQFYELIHRRADPIGRAVLVIDVREGRFLEQFPETLESLRNSGAPIHLLFFECSDEILKRRFSETRRPHPMVGTGNLEEGIRREREALAPLRERADRIIDTTRFTAHELRTFLKSSFGKAEEHGPLNLNLVSFGFKYGIPTEADLVFDVRFLPNPYFLEELRDEDGRSPAVRGFLDRQGDKREFMEHLKRMLAFLLPLSAAEGKAYLTIALGCTGGRHRSVGLAEELREYFAAEDLPVAVHHRDLGKE